MNATQRMLTARRGDIFHASILREVVMEIDERLTALEAHAAEDAVTAISLLMAAEVRYPMVQEPDWYLQQAALLRTDPSRERVALWRALQTACGDEGSATPEWYLLDALREIDGEAGVLTGIPPKRYRERRSDDR